MIGTKTESMMQQTAIWIIALQILTEHPGFLRIGGSRCCLQLLLEFVRCWAWLFFWWFGCSIETYLQIYWHCMRVLRLPCTIQPALKCRVSVRVFCFCPFLLVICYKKNFSFFVCWKCLKRFKLVINCNKSIVDIRFRKS